MSARKLLHQAIIRFRQEVENQRILSLGKRTKLAVAFIRFLYSSPGTDSREVAEELAISPATTARLIEDFIRLKILKEITGFKRNWIFVFDPYLKLFE